jgi:exopolysaccharide biosynthesis polyprenyl glycosylphosphotransferase
MIREKRYILTNLNKVLDVCLTSVALYLAIMVQPFISVSGIDGENGVEHNHLVFLILILFIWYIVFSWNTIYTSYRRRKFAVIMANLAKSCAMGSIFLVVAFYVLRIDSFSRTLLVTFLVIDFLILLTSKFIIYRLFFRLFDETHDVSHLLIVGTRTRASELIKKIVTTPDSGHKIIGCLGIDENEIGGTVYGDVRVTGTVSDIERYLKEAVVDELILALPLKLIKNADKYLILAEDMGVPVRIIPDWQVYYRMYDTNIATISFEDFMHTPTMVFQVTTRNEGALLIKSALDYLGAALILTMLLPFFIIVGVVIKYSSPGPVFFKQNRLGLHGRVFQVYKFRTMVENAEKLKEDMGLDRLNESEGPVFKIKNDPRIVPYVGSFLRKTNLDELPQLINVLRGEMSLVGPRPPIPSEVTEYEIWQRRRLSMKPGITCIWQIAPARNDIPFEDWMKMDLRYIDTWSLWLDFKILVLTARTVILGTGR